MVPLFSPVFWSVELLVSIAVCLWALQWRRFWSIRFLIAAAVLNILLLYFSSDTYQRANGPNAPGTPGWIVVPVFILEEFFTPLLLILASLSLLSFLPGGERRGSLRDNLLVASSVLVLLALLGFISYRTVVPPPPRKPLDPVQAFYPQRPLSSVLHVALRPIRAIFPDGTPTQFEITFTNTSQRGIDLTGLPLDGLRFHPYISLQQMRGAVDLSYGTDLKIPAGHEILRAGASLTLDFPEHPRTHRWPRNYDEDRMILNPGEYAAFAAFLLENDGQYERVLSQVVNFSVH